MRLIQTLAGITICAGLASCTSVPSQGYAGPTVPDSDTALVRATIPRGNVAIRSVRLLSIETTAGEFPLETRSARVLPGETCLTARSRNPELASAVLCFEAEAGKVYEVRPRNREIYFSPSTDAAAAPTRPAVQIIDMSTGSVVTSVRQ